MNQALECLIQNLDEIKSHFFGIKQDEIPNIIYDLVWDFNEESVPLNELYLRFAYEFTKLLNISILMFEKNHNINYSLYNNCMDELKGKIKNRIALKFFGGNINNLLEKHSSNSISNFEKNCISVYQKAIDYLEKWFDYENSIFKKLNNLNLDYQLDYCKANELAKDLSIKIDNSNLFDEITILNNEKDKIIKLLKDQNELETISQDKIWCKLIQPKKISFSSKNY